MNNVHITSIDNEIFKTLIQKYEPDQIIAIVDENTVGFLDDIHLITDINIDAIQLPSGEQFKNIQSLAGIWSDLTEHNFRRNGLIINLGGGVITDLGGFAAATYKRGVDFINIPTTLLSMVDAAIGGKTGIDFLDFKNQIGVIKDAEAVFCDVSFLESLPTQELLSGFAEVIKHGLIADEKYWRYCLGTPYTELKWNKVVKGSIEIKSGIVSRDPEEQGERKLLNFGHTIGHAIESLRLEQKPILHGFGVAAGMIMEAHISMQKGLLTEESFKKIQEKISTLFPKVVISKTEVPALLDIMKNDKKNNSDEINFTLLEEIGKGVFNQTASTDEIRKSLEYYIG